MPYLDLFKRRRDFLYFRPWVEKHETIVETFHMFLKLPARKHGWWGIGEAMVPPSLLNPFYSWVYLKH
jgi:hypothetical protein